MDFAKQGGIFILKPKITILIKKIILAQLSLLVPTVYLRSSYRILAEDFSKFLKAHNTAQFGLFFVFTKRHFLNLFITLPQKRKKKHYLVNHQW